MTPACEATLKSVFLTRWREHWDSLKGSERRAIQNGDPGHLFLATASKAPIPHPSNDLQARTLQEKFVLGTIRSRPCAHV